MILDFLVLYYIRHITCIAYALTVHNSVVRSRRKPMTNQSIIICQREHRTEMLL